MKRLLFAASLVAFSLPVSAQNMGTGAYPHATFDSPGFDSINTGNLNTRFSIPIISRSGRGLPFNYALQYEGLIWAPVTVGGTTTWVNDPNWGFSGTLNGDTFSGYLSHSTSITYCPLPHSQTATFSSSNNYVYHDPFGAAHSFNYYQTVTCPNPTTGAGPAGVTPGGTGQANDGSGYSIPTNTSNPTVVNRKNGSTITPGQSATGSDATSITDANGNQITKTGTNSFTDTLGVAALTVSGGGPVTFTYPVAQQANSATTASASLTYRTYTVRTNFQCSGITEYGSHSVSLVDAVTLADGSAYHFTYETTPGASDGAVTARLHSIMLPNNGQITYSYSGGCNGSGINPDGTVGSLSRQTTDGTRTYTRSSINNNATSTTVQDEKNNQTVYNFTIAGTSPAYIYETHRQVFQGSTGSSNLLDLFTCYNGAPASCDGQAVTPPLAEVDTVASYNGGTQLLTKNQYDTYGVLLASSSQYDGTSLLAKTALSYNSLGEVTSSTTSDGNANVMASSTFGYDETSATATSGIPQHVSVSGTRGNQTSSHVSTGSGTLDTTTAYYDTGVPVSTTANGGTTSYSYDSTQAFVTQTNLPTPSSGVALSTSATYSSTAASLLTSTGMNSGETTTVNQYDALLRPTKVTTPSGSVLTYSYSPGGVSQSQVLDSSSGRSATTATAFDAYGRTVRTAVYNGQSSNPWYQQDTCLDQIGMVKFVPTPYQSTGLTASVRCSGSGTTYTYDALGRPISVGTDDGTASIVYNNRAVKTTDVNGVQRITQYDLQGRIKSVCELSGSLGSDSPSDCGMKIAGTGFLTTYDYDTVNLKVTVHQGAQTRVFQTDAAGRTIATTEPERGSTTYAYSYNSFGLVVTRTRPKANQQSTAVTKTTTQYDLLGRLVSVSYDDGLTPNKNIFYDQTGPGQQWTGVSISNVKGRLTGTTSGTGSSLTRSLLSYDLAGNVTNMWQCAPSICGGSSQASRPISFQYDLGGSLTNEYDVTSGSIAYTRSAAGEVTSITNQTFTGSGNPANLVSNVANGPFGPNNYSLGNGLTSARNYDSLGRNSGTFVCSGSQDGTCNGANQIYGNTAGWSGNRTGVVCDTVLNQCESMGYDAFNRLTSVTHQSGGSNLNFTYTYDRWGNRTAQTPVNGTTGPGPAYSYNASNQITGQGTYDAAGNLTSDGLQHSYTYDAEGNVLQVDGGSTATYVYDSGNHRVGSRTSSNSYEYVYDAFGQQTSTWLTSQNFGVGGRIYWDGKQVAYRGANGGETMFQHQDYLGTERMRTTASGQVGSTESSLPFGDAFTKNTNAISDPDTKQFAGQEYDSESSTDHAQFRQYSPLQGRWMSPDPYDGSYDVTDPQSLNRYTYALNSPLAYVDPDGTSITSISCDANGVCTIHVTASAPVLSPSGCGFLCQSQKPVSGPTGMGQTGPGVNSAPANAPSNVPLIPKGTCTGIAVAAGAGVGAVLGSEVGAAAGALVGAASGSFALPGGGTIGGGVAGGLAGAGIGAGVGGFLGGLAGGAASNVLCSTNGNTVHGGDRGSERGFSQGDIDVAKTTAKETGQVTTQIGKYGTPQKVYNGTNGLTVVVETEGRNAGKVITGWWR